MHGRPRIWLLAVVGLLGGLNGCQKPTAQPVSSETPTTTKQDPIRLLIIDDPELAVAIPRQWQARAERELVVRQLSSAELKGGENRRLAADAVIYPSGLLGELAARQLIEPFDEKVLNGAVFERSDVFDLSRLREVAWSNQILAVSLGSPQFNLLYRRDIFERLQLRPPVNWEDYQTLLGRLADRSLLGEFAPPAGQDWSAVVEPLAAEWAGQLLMARAAAYAQHRSQFSTLFDYRTMKPLIDGPPFVRALEELVASRKYFPEDVRQLGPSQARRELLAGHCAMAITWPSRADDQSTSDSPVAVSFSELPGSLQAYNFRSQSWEARGDEAEQRVTLAAVSGRLASVTRESRQPSAATNLLAWVCGKLSAEICPESKQTTLFRESHLQAVPRWIDRQFDAEAARSYGLTVQQAQSRPSWLASVRIPGRQKYLAALDQAVYDALDGMKPQDALAKAAQQWNAITDSLGREPQRQAYMQSIGLEP